MEEQAKNEVVVKQSSKMGNVVTVVGLGVGITATLLIAKKLKDQRSLVKVRFIKENIPNYTRKQLVEFRDVCCNGEKPKTGRIAQCEVHDPKRVACAWVPKVLGYMDANKMDIFFMWKPGLISQRLYEEMKGIAFGEAVWNVTKSAILGPMAAFIDTAPISDYNSREGLFIAISKLNVDQLRWLHNWWILHHADGDNLYEWIRGEVGVSVSIRNAATGAMDRAGVGSKIVIDRNKIA